MHTPVIQTSVNFTIFNFNYIFSADISPEMLKLGRVTKVKVLFLVLVFVFNFDLFLIFGRHFGKGSIGWYVPKYTETFVYR